MNGDSGYAAISSMDRLSIEPEKIKRWREEHSQMLQEKGIQSRLTVLFD